MRPLVFLPFWIACATAPARPVAPATPSSAVLVSDPLALLPANSSFVIVLDGAALRRSPLFAKYRATLREFLLPGFAGCDYDPLDDIATMTMGVPLDGSLGLFVFRNVDRERTVDCLRSSKVATRTEAAFDGAFITLRNVSGVTNIVTFVDPKTAVMQGSGAPTKDTLARALRSGSPLREDKVLVAMLREIAPGAVLTVAGVPSSSALAEHIQKALGMPAHHVTAEVRITDVVTLRAKMVMADAGAASVIVARVQPQLEGLRAFTDRYEIRAEGATVLVDLAITEAQIQTLVDLSKSLRGQP